MADRTSVPDDEKRAWENVRFLIEQAHVTDGHRWTRANVMVAINAVALAAVLAALTTNRPLPWWLGVVASLAGTVICFLWWQLNRISEFLSFRWEHDARVIAQRHPEIRSAFFISLMFREQAKKEDSHMPNPQPSWFRDRFFDLERPRNCPTQTRSLNAVIGVFALVWICAGGAYLFGQTSERRLEGSAQDPATRPASQLAPAERAPARTGTAQGPSPEIIAACLSALGVCVAGGLAYLGYSLVRGSLIEEKELSKNDQSEVTRWAKRRDRPSIGVGIGMLIAALAIVVLSLWRTWRG